MGGGLGDGRFLILSHCTTAASITIHSSSPRIIPPLLVLVCLPNSDAERCTESNSHECPVPHCKPLCQRVEGDVAAWTFWIMVGRTELSSCGVEPSTGDH